MTDRIISRREFLKTTAAAIGAAIPSFRLEGSSSSEENDGEEFLPILVDLEQKFPYTLADYVSASRFDYALSVSLPELAGTAVDLYSPILDETKYMYMDTETGRWKFFKYQNLPSYDQIPLEIRNTKPMRGIVPQDLKQYEKLVYQIDPVEVFETIVKLNSPLTRENCFPSLAAEQGLLDARTLALWNRLQEVIPVYSVIKMKVKDYEMHLINNPIDVPLGFEKKRLSELLRNLEENYLKNTMLEFWARTSNRHGLYDERVHEGGGVSRYDSSLGCYVLITDILSFYESVRRGRPICPTEVDRDGNLSMRDDYPLSVEGIGEWFEQMSRHYGWQQVADINEQSMIKMSNTNFFVEINRNQLGKPEHIAILRGYVGSFRGSGKLFRVDRRGNLMLNSIYTPLNEQDYINFRNPDFNTLIYAHPY